MDQKVDRKPAPEPRTFSGRAARQGDIVLRTPARRAIFIAGLVGIVIVAFIVGALAWW